MQLYLLDPDIVGGGGHYTEYAAAIRDEAVRRGVEVTVLANRRVDAAVAARLAAVPVFRRGHSEPAGILPRLGGGLGEGMRASAVYARDAGRALRGRVGSTAVIFAPTVGERQLLGWALLLRRLPVGTQVALLLRYSVATYDHPGVATLPRTPRAVFIRAAFRALERAARGRRLRLLTDSRRLVEEYTHLTRLPVEVLPIPHTADMPESPPRAAYSATTRFVSLGDARMEKGFPLLADAIQHLDRTGRLAGMEFVLQRNVRGDGAEEVEAAVARLEALDLPEVTMVGGPMPREAYLGHLRWADAALLPYRRREYCARTSGPFTEALGAGRIAVVTADTWMSDQLAEHGAGVTFRDGDAVDLARAIRDVHVARTELAQHAMEARVRWLDVHNPATFIDALVPAVQSGAGAP